MENVLDFAAFKKKFDTSEVYVGDKVEWHDYDGAVCHGIVHEIEYMSFDGYFSDSPKCFPIWEKGDYVVHLGEGLVIAGSAIVSKIVRKSSDEKNFHKYSKAQ